MGPLNSISKMSTDNFTCAGDWWKGALMEFTTSAVYTWASAVVSAVAVLSAGGDEHAAMINEPFVNGIVLAALMSSPSMSLVVMSTPSSRLPSLSASRSTLCGSLCTSCSRLSVPLPVVSLPGPRLALAASATLLTLVPRLMSPMSTTTRTTTSATPSSLTLFSPSSSGTCTRLSWSTSATCLPPSAPSLLACRTSALPTPPLPSLAATSTLPALLLLPSSLARPTRSSSSSLLPSLVLALPSWPTTTSSPPSTPPRLAPPSSPLTTRTSPPPPPTLTSKRHPVK